MRRRTTRPKRLRNPAIAERSRDYRTTYMGVDEYGDKIELKPPSKWKTDMTPARLTRGHDRLPETIEAARWAARLDMEGYRTRDGEYHRAQHLGSGNFGHAYRVDTDDGPRVVKVPTAVSIHQRPWSLAEQTRNMLHEAGIANELAAKGYSVIPRIVFTRYGGTPTLVREYGEPAGTITPVEYAGLERQLVEIERKHGWGVHDNLALYRRRNGSIFVGDVGFWRAPEKRPRGTKRKPWKEFDSSLGSLLSLAQRDYGVPSVTTLARLLAEGQHFDRDDVKAPSDFAAGMAEDFIEEVEGRRAEGIPTSREIARYVRLARRVIRAFGRPSKHSERARAARRAAAGVE
jgi:hypothetical protein